MFKIVVVCAALLFSIGLLCMVRQESRDLKEIENETNARVNRLCTRYKNNMFANFILDHDFLMDSDFLKMKNSGNDLCHEITEIPYITYDIDNWFL